jgi:hypothetical protein
MEIEFLPEAPPPIVKTRRSVGNEFRAALVKNSGKFGVYPASYTVEASALGLASTVRTSRGGWAGHSWTVQLTDGPLVKTDDGNEVPSFRMAVRHDRIWDEVDWQDHAEREARLESDAAAAREARAAQLAQAQEEAAATGAALPEPVKRGRKPKPSADVTDGPVDSVVA